MNRVDIGKLIGEASMLFNTPDGTFNNKRASEIVDEIEDYINKLKQEIKVLKTPLARVLYNETSRKIDET